MKVGIPKFDGSLAAEPAHIDKQRIHLIVPISLCQDALGMGVSRTTQPAYSLPPASLAAFTTLGVMIRLCDFVISVSSISQGTHSTMRCRSRRQIFVTSSGGIADLRSSFRLCGRTVQLCVSKNAYQHAARDGTDGHALLREAIGGDCDRGFEPGSGH